ncbi:hypothetical protein N7U66_05385 [Lacinutrix neustonica]|uniref:DUF6933 domain-containing protein n=1 Tax=Lacinutrix neustonica TaxID=2980107 RepID=A0A9E8MVJ6_9FLAO|nr:hypothetical protein [Lacinutrix neustonica]WAC02156.1 hypothetical protein N7U66_20670 [Lacinutrix neustonica]WAC03062.1 hypothetical protein N7U66_05385 [Lacinutrix neustonica]
MTTPIYISKKLEKLVSKYVSQPTIESISKLGKWNGTVFYVNRKKCWLIVNAETKFSLIIPDLKASDIKNFQNVFLDNLYSQFIYENIILDFKELKRYIGEINILPTDGDRKTIGTQNYYLENIEYWKYEYGTFENMPFRDIAKRLNFTPTEVFKWKNPREVMITKIKTCA